MLRNPYPISLLLFSEAVRSVSEVLGSWQTSFLDAEFHHGMIFFHKMCTLPITNVCPEKWWLGDNPFLLGIPIFRGELEL